MFEEEDEAAKAGKPSKKVCTLNGFVTNFLFIF